MYDTTDIVTVVGLIVAIVGSVIAFIAWFVFGGVLPTLTNPETANILFAIGVPAIVGGFGAMAFAYIVDAGC